MNGRYEVAAIGWVESPLLERAHAPRQGDEGAPSAWIVFEPGVAKAVRDLRAGDHVIVVSWLDRARRDVLTTHPRDDPDSPLLGVFSTRSRSEEHTSELQSRENLVCRLLLEKKKKTNISRAVQESGTIQQA